MRIALLCIALTCALLNLRIFTGLLIGGLLAACIAPLGEGSMLPKVQLVVEALGLLSGGLWALMVHLRRSKLERA